MLLFNYLYAGMVQKNVHFYVPACLTVWPDK